MTRQPTSTRRGWVVLRWLFVLALVGVSLQALALFVRSEARLLPVRSIAIDGEVHRHSLAVLQETVAEQLDGGILLVDLAAIKGAVEALPWIASVSLRRDWPDRLQLRVVEHRPVARWGDDGLVTAIGTVFRPDPATIPRGLPRLRGEDRDAAAVVKRYFGWRDRLAELGLRIRILERHAWGAWRMELAQGTAAEVRGGAPRSRGLGTEASRAVRSPLPGSEGEETARPQPSFSVALGSRQVEARFTRFLRAYPALRLTHLPVAVDLRYANGFAVRWAASAGAMRSAATGGSAKGSRDRG